MEKAKLENMVINKSMKKFRSIKADAKAEGVDLNAVFYTGGRLTPLQIGLTKELIYSFTALNKEFGKENADAVIGKVVTDVAMDLIIQDII